MPHGVKRFTEKGLVTDDGQTEEFDIIICATGTTSTSYSTPYHTLLIHTPGYDTTFQYPFPIVGRNGVTLNDKWSPHPVTYLACCVDSFPNYFFSLGPNAAVGSGSLTAVIERHVEFAVKATQKLQRERLRSIEVKEEALKDFDEYLEVSPMSFSATASS